MLANKIKNAKDDHSKINLMKPQTYYEAELTVKTCR